MNPDSGFQPAWWLPGAHLQTLWPFLFRPVPPTGLTSERLELPDGDFVDLRHLPGDAGPVVAIFHGLEGSIHSHYAVRLLQALRARRWRAVFMHFRGCSGVHNRLLRSYHSGDTADIAILLDVLKQRYPDAPLFAVGFSLGGNALLKYLGEHGASARPDAAVAVSVPLLLADSAARLNRGLSRLYQRHLLASLRRKTMSKYTRMRVAFDRRQIAGLRSFYAFDDHVTAPLHGFTGADDYYRRSSSRQYLRRITVPTLIIHARDDPFMTGAALPGPGELGERVELELSRHGGHVGFVSGRLPWQPVYWLNRRIPGFLQRFTSAAPKSPPPVTRQSNPSVDQTP